MRMEARDLLDADDAFVHRLVREPRRADQVAENTRLQYRYLDIRRERMQRNIRLRASVNSAIRRAMEEQGFVEVETPMLVPSTPEGAREFIVPSRQQPGSFYALPQSPQLFKQLLMVAGIDRYYQIARCLRDEDLRADRQYEFMQLDAEMSFVSQDDVHRAIGNAVVAAARAAGQEPGEIVKITWHEAMNRFGVDKPDLRFGIELTELTDVFAGTEFKAFAGAACIKGINAVGKADDYGRNKLDAMTDKAKKMASWFKGELPKLDWSSVPQKSGEATRAASKNVLEFLAGKVENLVVMSADLADSDYTEGFLKKTSIFKKGDFSGSFLQAGVAELTMAGIMNGIALHGGLIPVGGTFFVFSDFQKPALRLAALQEAKVIFLWSHDAFRVGEDGPTHQPIEQEAQLRLLERIANLEGKRSFLALRPGDASETTVAWKLALEAHVPASIVLTRQPVGELPALKGNRFAETESNMGKGAYVVVDCEGKPDIILLANGSEASLLVEGGEKLKAKGLKVRVVSAPSEGLFRDQSESYRESVIPYGLPVLGWTAGEPSTLRNLVGPLGKVYGMSRFGASAPFKVLDGKFGYTSDNVVAVAEAYLAEYKANVKKIAALA